MFNETPQLLASMAMRTRHDFGLLEPEQQQGLITEMKELYRYYQEGLSNEDIAQKTGYYHVTIGQVREEVNGTGFFQPQK